MSLHCEERKNSTRLRDLLWVEAVSLVLRMIVDLLCVKKILIGSSLQIQIQFI